MTATPTPSTTATPGGTTARITGLDKVGEVVTLSAPGDLTGWKPVSLTGSQTFSFPAGLVASGILQVKSATPLFPNTPSTLWWSTANIWNNSSNNAAGLYDCTGQLVQTFDDGQ